MQKKNVLVLSTAHATEKIDFKTRKPVIIQVYNENKGGVDTFDQMLRGYTSKRKSNRWPMSIFCNMIDAAAFAAYRLYELSHPKWNTNKNEKRKIFLKELAQKHMSNRCENRLKSSVKTAMNLIGFRVPKTVRTPLEMPIIQVI